MCGIWGLVHRGSDAPPVTAEQMQRLGRALVHRGPDETGIFAQGPVGLGVHRLRVIDLVSGQQPVTNEDGSLVLVFNGEVYNHEDLRAALMSRGHRFRGRSDTEVIVHLYEDEGPECLARLNGIFAIALWDSRRQRLFLARDRLGVKPLYYHDHATHICFGSELKPLMAAAESGLELDPQAVSDYLSLGYVLGPKTVFQGVRQLPAGCYALWDGAGLRVEPYWDLRFGTTAPRPVQEYEERLLELLRTAVRRQMISDVPLGAFLSGGVDSSLVVALMAQAISRPVHTFSVRFREATYDESPYAQLVSDHLGTEHSEVLCEPEGCVDLVRALPYYADGLCADLSLVPMYAVSQAARRRVTVTLSGDGGDELFAGYPTYQADVLWRGYQRLPRWLRPPLEALIGGLPPSARKLSLSYTGRKFLEGARYPSGKAHYWWRTMFTDAEKSELLRGDWQQGLSSYDPYETFAGYFNSAAESPEPLDRFQYVDCKTWLVDNILVKVDRMSMANALEARVPLLDHELVEFCCAIPAGVRMRGLQTKSLFKRVASTLLPERVVHRKKAGFLPALATWFRTAWKELLGDALCADALRRMGWLDDRMVQRLLREHWAGTHDHAVKLWNLLILSQWHAWYAEGGWRADAARPLVHLGAAG